MVNVKSNVLLLSLISLIFLSSLVFITGCSGSNLKEEKNEFKEDQFSNWSICVQKLNDLAGVSQDEYGLNLEQDGDSLRVTLGNELDKCLASICSNYSVATNQSQTLDPEQIRLSLTDNFATTADESMADDWKSNILYKLFEWCNSPAKENAIYYGGEGFNDELCQKFLEEGYTVNYDIILNQVHSKERNESPAYKFKWQ